MKTTAEERERFKLYRREYRAKQREHRDNLKTLAHSGITVKMETRDGVEGLYVSAKFTQPQLDALQELARHGAHGRRNDRPGHAAGNDAGLAAGTGRQERGQVMPKYKYHVAIFYGAEKGEWARDIEIQNRQGNKEITSRQPLDKWLEQVTSLPGGEVISITQTNDNILTAIVRTDGRDRMDASAS